MAPLGVSQSMSNAQIATALSEVAWILSVSTGPTEGGGTKDTFTKADASVMCAVAPKSGGIYVGRSGSGGKAAGDRDEDRTLNVITLAGTPTVKERDRIEIDGRGIFEVTILYRRSTEIARQVEAREVF